MRIFHVFSTLLCCLNFAIIKCYRKRTIFTSSVWEMNFLSLFIWIWIKFNFPLESPIAYFFRSLINSSRETYLSWTKKNRDVSSAKILHVEIRPSLKSFIYIKIKRRPRSESCETLNFTTSQGELCPLGTLCCALEVNSWRSIIVHTQYHMIPVWKEAPHATPYQMPLLSIVVLQSKEELIPWTIDNNWKMQ